MFVVYLLLTTSRRCSGRAAFSSSKLVLSMNATTKNHYSKIEIIEDALKLIGSLDNYLMITKGLAYYLCREEKKKGDGDGDDSVRFSYLQFAS